MGKKDNATGDGAVGGFDPEGDGSAPAFDIGFEPFYRSRLEPPVRAAQEFATQARGKLFEGLTRQLAESSVYGGEMAQRVAAQLAAPVQAAAEFHANAGSRIGTVLAQPVFDAAAWGEPWGAFPALEPGMIPPARVLEAREMFGLRQLGIPPAPDGGQLVISPATFDTTWQEYRDQVLPLRGYDFDRYTLRLQELETRFPPSSSYRSEWQSRVAAAEADAPIGINPDAQAVTKPFIDAQQAPPASAGGEPVPVSGGAPFTDIRPIPPKGGMIPAPGGGGVSILPSKPPAGMAGGLPVDAVDVPVYDPTAPDAPFLILWGPPVSGPNGLSCPIGQRPVYLLPGKDPRYPAGGYYCASQGVPPPSQQPPTIPPTPTPGTGPSPPASGPAPCVAICGMD